MSAATRRVIDGPGPFAFADATLAAARREMAKYPPGRQRSAVLPVLDLVQRQDGWVSRQAMDAVAELLGMAPMEVYENATFYTMINLAPTGRHHVQVCTNISCWLRDSDAVVRACKETLGIGFGEISADGAFTLSEVECLGACVNAPMMQIGDDYYEDLDAQSTRSVLEALREGRTPKPGSQTGRAASAPAGGPKTLLEVK